MESELGEATYNNMPVAISLIIVSSLSSTRLLDKWRNTLDTLDTLDIIPISSLSKRMNCCKPAFVAYGLTMRFIANC